MEGSAARRDTPGCAADGGPIHLDAAGSALQPRAVVDAVLTHVAAEAELGAAAAAAEAAPAVAGVYAALAELLGCHPDEVAVTDSAAGGLRAVLRSLRLAPGDRVLAAGLGPTATLALGRDCDAAGAALVPVPADPAAVRAACCPRARLVVAEHVSAAGEVRPAAAIGAVAAALEVPFLLDGSRSIGQLQLDVRALRADYLTAGAGGYLRGPRGTGVLFARRGRRAAGALPLAAAAQRFEPAECYLPAKLGLGAAARYALAQGLPAITVRLRLLAAELRLLLSRVSGVQLVHGGGGPAAATAAVAFRCSGLPAAEVARRLRGHGVSVGVAGAGAAVLVATPHCYTSVPEMQDMAQLLAQLLAELDADATAAAEPAAEAPADADAAADVDDPLALSGDWQDWVELDGQISEPPSPVAPSRAELFPAHAAGVTEPNPVFDGELAGEPQPPDRELEPEPEPEPEPAAAERAETPTAGAAGPGTTPPTPGAAPVPVPRSAGPAPTQTSLLFVGASPPGFGVQFVGGPLLGHNLGSLGCSPQSLLGHSSPSPVMGLPCTVAGSCGQEGVAGSAAAQPQDDCHVNGTPPWSAPSNHLPSNQLECYLNGMCCDDESIDGDGDGDGDEAVAEPHPVAAGIGAAPAVVGFSASARVAVANDGRVTPVSPAEGSSGKARPSALDDRRYRNSCFVHDF